jgi:hypothetical protein
MPKLRSFSTTARPIRPNPTIPNVPPSIRFRGERLPHPDAADRNNRSQ